MAMVLSWILKKPLDEFEDYDDDEEEFDLESDEELLYGPPSAQGGTKLFLFVFRYDNYIRFFFIVFLFIYLHTSLLVFIL